MKKIIFTLTFLLSILSNSEAQSDNSSSPFIKPWNDIEKPIIIDVYSKNDYTINQITKEKRIKGIIHKLSIEDSSIFIKEEKKPTKIICFLVHIICLNTTQTAKNKLINI